MGESTHWQSRLVVAAVLGCAVAFPLTGEAKSDAGQAAPAAESAAALSPQAAQEALRENVRAQLSGTSWTLELKPDAGGKALQDTVSFEGRTVSSKWLTKSGYNTSNYSLQVQEDGIATWETMQSKGAEGLAFWRGDVQGDTMSGALSQQPKEGPSVSYSFTARKVASAQPAAAVPEAASAQPRAAPAPQAQQQPAVVAPTAVAKPAPAPSSTPKKKRGWF